MSELPPFPTRLVEAAKAGKKLTPRAMGELADTFKAYEAARLAADKAAEAIKKQESTIKAALIASLKLADVSAIGGQTFKVEHSQVDEPTVKDWPKFYKHIVDNDAFDLLERRVSKTAVKERWEDGKQVPGVDKFPVDKLSFSKLKG